MKKIAIFYKSYQKYGGQEKVIWNLSHYLANAGYTLNIYTTKIKDKPENNNIHLKKVLIHNLGIGLKTLIFALYAANKAKHMEDYCIMGFGKTFIQDIYKADGGVHKYYFKRAKFKYRNNLSRFFYVLKKIFTLSHWVNIWIENKIYSNKRLKIVIVPSEFVKRQILETFRSFDESKIVLIRNDVSTQRFDYSKKNEIQKTARKRLNLSNEDTIFSFVSTNHRLKGLEYLLGACQILKSQGYNFKLVIAGNGNASYFKKIIRKYKLIENVKCLGVVKNVENIYYASDFLVYPTLFDTFGLVVLESMACGTPVICSRYAGAAEIIEDNTFIIKNPQDIQEIAKKMEYVIKNESLWYVWSKKASDTAKRYSTNTSSKRILEITQMLCK